MNQNVAVSFLRYHRADTVAGGTLLPPDPGTCAVLPALHGWIPRYDRRLDTFNAEAALEAAGSLSAVTGATVLTVLLCRGDAMLVALSQNGGTVSELCTPAAAYSDFFPMRLSEPHDPRARLSAGMLEAWGNLSQLLRFSAGSDEHVRETIEVIGSPLLGRIETLKPEAQRAMLVDFLRTANSLAATVAREDAAGVSPTVIRVRILTLDMAELPDETLARVAALREGRPWNGETPSQVLRVETAHWLQTNAGQLFPAQPAIGRFVVPHAPLVAYGLGFIGSLCRPQVPAFKIQELLGGTDAQASFNTLKALLNLPLPFSTYREASRNREAPGAAGMPALYGPTREVG